MTDTHALVAEFHRTFGHPVREGKPSLEHMSIERREMRLNLIREEVGELYYALVAPGDIVEVADALADLAYVIHGFALEAGIPLNEVITEVHRSNMGKLGADGKPIYREDGKVLKGPDYSPPDIAAVLAEHGGRPIP